MECLKALFRKLEPIIDYLHLAPEVISYYAQFLIKSQIFQISRREDNKYLLLIAFVIHQYYRLNDVLVEILIQASQTSINTSAREHKESFYEARRSMHQIISNVSKSMINHISTLQKIEEVIHGHELT